MLRIALFTTLMFGVNVNAHAQDTPEPTESTSDADSAVTSRDSNERSTNMEVGLRLRSMSIPKAILDIWFFDDDAPGWAYSEPRPNVTALAYGMEFAIKNDGAMGVFYFDYIDSNMEPGYWDDQDDPPDHLDGDFLKPENNFGFAALGADYYQDIPILKSDKTNEPSPCTFGGRRPRTRHADGRHRTLAGNRHRLLGLRAVSRRELGRRKELPQFIPLLDVNAGLRFAFGDRASIRLEGVYTGSTGAPLPA